MAKKKATKKKKAVRKKTTGRVIKKKVAPVKAAKKTSGGRKKAATKKTSGKKKSGKKKSAVSTAGGGPRLFEFHSGKSDKFWEIDLNGNSHTVRYGRVGTDGQTSTKKFADAEKAKASYQKLIDQKVGKGYAEVSSKADSRSESIKASKASLKEREPFLKAILDDPDDITGYMIFADWLEGKEDPRGEFIRVQLALEDENLKAPQRKKLRSREKSLLKKHGTEWLEDLGAALIDAEEPEDLWRRRGRLYDWEMSRGFIGTLKIDYLFPEFATLLKKSTVAATLKRLLIRDPSNGGALVDTEQYADRKWDFNDIPGLKALIGTKFSNLRHLEIGDRNDQCHATATDVDKLVKLTPRLESLYLEARNVDTGKLFRLKLPELRSLDVHHLSQRYRLDVLAKNASLTKLESINFFPHMMEPWHTEPYIDFAGFKALCRSRHLPGLKHLTLHCSEIGDAGIAELIKSPLLGQLRTLRLIYGTITDKGAEQLQAAKLDHLEKFDLTGNYLSKAAVKSLTAHCDRLKAGHQHGGEPDFDERQHLWYGDME